ncbi:hypothetical protein SLEP1_g20117 [Rubroshorea leprosula]|uniref:GBF-interacting protein 1 N-terminal domain-containing protein n=1 Tax=Rubroshorea leprosula TaxID=152421 RepID=A0AAV5J720_9ROSI|nr:hypothetical protein SLEP1_g20117 [Rubroshorea leprosula]
MSSSGGDGSGGGGGGGGGQGFRGLIPGNVKKTIQRIREIIGKKLSDEDIYSVLKECDMDPNVTVQKLLCLGIGQGFRVLIPDNAKKTIQSIREITGKKHSDEDIYSLLRECGMDPNETVQKLLCLDTFHEVKSKKRDRKKEPAGTQGRGTRGNYYSNSTLSDVEGGRNAPARRENGINHITDRGSIPLPVSQRGKNNPVYNIKRTPTADPNGTENLSNRNSIHAQVTKMPADGDSKGTKVALPVNVKKSAAATVLLGLPAVKESSNSVSLQTLASLVCNQEKPILSSKESSTAAITPVSGVYSPASDPALAPSLPHHAGAVGTVEHEVGRQQEAVVNHIQGNNTISNDSNSVHSDKAPHIPNAAEQIDPSVSVEPSLPEANTSEVATVAVKDGSKLPLSLNTLDGKHVTFPTHFQVSEALKTGLTFGSFDPSFGLLMTYNNDTNGEINSVHAVESSQGSDVTVEEPSPSNQSVSSALQGDASEQPQIPTVFEKVLESDGNNLSTADLKNIQSNKEMRVQSESNQSQNVPSYNFGFMPPLSTSHFVQFNGPAAQAHDVSCFSNGVNGNAPASSSSSMPPVSSSVAVPPQAVPLFRQSFPPNYFPYGHYLSHFLIPPIHQFFGPNGLPQQPSTGNIYLPPGAPSSGVKFPLPQFKPGTNAGGATHITIPSSYGSYNPPLVGFNPVPVASSGDSTGEEDLAASQLKEKRVYTTGTMSEGPALWMPTPGQELSNLPLSSLINLSLQGHVAFSPAQAGHGAFAGLYQTAQTMAAPLSVNPPHQQSQPTAAETMGPPTAYQQPQLPQLTWNANY